MPSLNEIINQNVTFFVERAEEKARAEGRKSQLYSHYAREMARFVPMGDPLKTFRQLRAGERAEKPQLWRSDYMDAFCSATGMAPEDLVSSTYIGRMKAGEPAAVAQPKPRHSRKSARKRIRLMKSAT